MLERSNDLLIVVLVSIVELCNPYWQKKRVTVDISLEVLEKVASGGGESITFHGVFWGLWSDYRHLRSESSRDIG